MNVYLDYAASTPTDPQAAAVMQPYFTEAFANANSVHSFGQDAKKVLEAARHTVATHLKAKTGEIIFTASATESNNFAIKGVAFANQDKGRHIIISAVEHHSILDTAKWMEKFGFEIMLAPVDRHGLVDPAEIEKLIRPDTILVSVMHANNELGTIEPIGEIGAICKKHGVLFHTDAAQTFGLLGIDVNRMNIDLLTASSQKMYGPKGAACLYVRTGVAIDNLLHGGGHEMGKRSSTVNLPAIAGFAKAVELEGERAQEDRERITALRDRFEQEVLREIDGATVNGHPSKRLPGLSNITFSGVDGEMLLMELDRQGIAASAASACIARQGEISSVLKACGFAIEDARSSLRFSLGRVTTEEEIDYVLAVLPKAVEKVRNISNS